MAKIEVDKQLEDIKKVASLNEGKNLKYCILTMGCQLNENDSEKLCGMMESMNYTKTDKLSDTDLIVFNTCCVRENAEDKLFGKLGEVKKYKEAKGTIIAIGGCMMQEKHIVDKLKQSYPFFDIVFGTHTLQEFPTDLYNVLCNKKRIEDVLDIDGDVIEGLPISREDKIKASVTIMNGCNNFCSYCIVPYVRGRERSREPRDIINEVKKLAEQGYKEITLLGQNVNSYLRNEKEKGIEFEQYEGVNSFATLLRAINKIDGIERIRFVSPHPKDFTDDVIEAIRDCEKVCKLVHLPLQSGSSGILKVMNRKYTKDQYLSLVEKMKNQIPNLTLSTDIIVGFPGETEEDFEILYNFVKEMRFDRLGVFTYSQEEGTPAASYADQIDEKVKVKRRDAIMALQHGISQELTAAKVGQEMQVLIEGKITDEDVYIGRTYQDAPDIDGEVFVEYEGELISGDFVNVRITEANDYDLIGEIVDEYSE